MRIIRNGATGRGQTGKAKCRAAMVKTVVAVILTFSAAASVQAKTVFYCEHYQLFKVTNALPSSGLNCDLFNPNVCFSQVPVNFGLLLGSYSNPLNAYDYYEEDVWEQGHSYKIWCASTSLVDWEWVL